MKLEDVCKVFTDGDWIESKDQSDNGIRLIQTGNIGEGVYLEKSERAKYVSQDTFAALKCTEIYSGDVLVSRLPEPVGRACIIPPKSERMITAVDCTICRPNEEIVLKEYLCYFMQSDVYYNRLLNNVTGTTRKRISRKNLGNVEINVPNIDKQRAIIAKLDIISNIIDERKRELEQLDVLIKARFAEMFGDGNYPVVKLGEACKKITDGTHKTPNYLDEGITFISAKNIVNGELDFSDVKYISEEEYLVIQKRCQTEKSDILLSKSGSLGFPVIVKTDEKLGLFESLAVLKYEKDRFIPEFLCEQLKTDMVQRQFTSGTKGVAIKHLHLGVIANTDIIVPPVEEQKEFAYFVHQVDKSKVAVHKALDETQTLFDSLMQEYFG
ncbi:restriction endonuclease subunit S [Anaerovibrio lipolyticus]|uniref:restriction endonuclease subunit S n=1 Tax=Anaerovibrio lipolyticus TaxID=82374 RepID=UPI0006844789|nr:restriction endonuclease subunit S [Anaerovibrio lipolyticus]